MDCAHSRLRIVRNGLVVACEHCPREWHHMDVQPDGSQGVRVEITSTASTIPAPPEGLDDESLDELEPCKS